jgi:hypothetical protein
LRSIAVFLACCVIHAESVGRDPGEHDPPAAELDEEQHIQRLEPDRFHGEEVACHDRLGLRL